MGVAAKFQNLIKLNYQIAYIIKILERNYKNK